MDIAPNWNDVETGNIHPASPPLNLPLYPIYHSTKKAKITGKKGKTHYYIIWNSNEFLSCSLSIDSFTYLFTCLFMGFFHKEGKDIGNNRDAPGFRNQNQNNRLFIRFCRK